MSKPRYKVTVFARFIMFLTLFLPMCYFAFSIIKGQSKYQILESLKTKTFELFSSSEDNNLSEHYAQLLAAKDEEIQLLKEKLFICQRSK
jgi:hypothetical protein